MKGTKDLWGNITLRLFLICILFSVSFLPVITHAQVSRDSSLLFSSIIDSIEIRFSVSIYYTKEIDENLILVYREYSNIEEALDDILEDTGFGYLNYRGHSYILAPANQINRNYDESYYQSKEIAEEDLIFPDHEELLTIGSNEQYDPAKPIVLRGFVNDEASDEPILGATILIEELNEGTATNEIGQYSFIVNTGNYHLKINSVGYEERRLFVNILSTGDLDIAMLKEAVLLNEIVVTGENEASKVVSAQSGFETLSTKEIKKLPAFAGEVDIVKSLLLLPGVSTVGEGAGGINVRGGTVDQNLIMQDGMYLFNSSHVLGLFSVFNSDIVQNVDLYKGSIPAKYGGKLSSVLNVKLRDGDYQKLKGRGGLGFVSNRLTIESPVKKGVSSVIASVRTSYSDWIFILVNIADLRQSSALFYDGNFKFAHRFKNKGKLTIGSYFSHDRFKFSDKFDFKWQTRGLIGNFNYLLGDDVSFSLEAVYSKYSSNWHEPSINKSFNLASDIRYFKIRPEFTLSILHAHNTVVGVEANRYWVHPGSLSPVTLQSGTIAKTVELEKGRDYSFYLNDEYSFHEKITLIVGIRYALFQSLGPALVNIYESDGPLNTETKVGSDIFGKGEVIAQYSGIEPRVSLKIGLDNTTSVKMSYARNQQFIHQLSNTTAVSPVDVWQLSNKHIQPQTSDNYSIGLFKNFDDNQWETSAEIYYRSIDRLIEYKDLADLLVNDHIETELLSGIGRSYGFELSVKKKAGRLNGWLGYTFSKTERKTNSSIGEESINENRWFDSNFDKPHDLSLAISYNFTKRNYFSVNFVYSSGRPITAPVGNFSVGNVLNIPFYSERNALRIPAYHRLDISYTIEQSHRKNQFWRSSWTFSVFNVYGRKNAFTVFFTQSPFSNPTINRLSILGSAFPSLTYNFNF